jgi:hypothetical protein
MEQNYFYQLHVSPLGNQEDNWRRVLVFQETMMSDLYLIVETIMDLFDINRRQYADKFNLKEYKNKKIKEIFKEINTEIIVKIPIGEERETHQQTIKIRVVFEKNIVQSSLDLCPLCIHGENRGKDESYFTLNSINARLKLWNLNYYEILCQTKTKAELSELANFLGIRVPAKLNKEGFAKSLEATIIKHPEIIKEIISQRDMKILSHLICSVSHSDGFNIDDIVSLADWGFLYLNISPDTIKPISIPNNIAFLLYDHLLEMCEEQQYKNDYIIENYLLGLINLYGVLSVDKAIELLETYFEIKQELTDLILITKKSFKVFKRLNVIRHNHQYYIVNNLIRDRIKIIDSIESRGDLTHKLFSKQEINDASLKRYFHQNIYSQKLIEIMDKKGSGNGYYAMHYLWSAIQNELDIPSILDIVNREIDLGNIDFLNKVFNHVMEYGNNIPKWILKGNSSSDLFQKQRYNNTQSSHSPKSAGLSADADSLGSQPFSKKGTIPVVPQKTQRNDPCPCGSGKKFKNCCGNN